MLFEEDYLDISGDLLSEMRPLVEGAITLFEDDTGRLNAVAFDRFSMELYTDQQPIAS